MAPLCKLGTTTSWFVEDYRRCSMELLVDLGNLMDLPQDSQTLGSTPVDEDNQSGRDRDYFRQARRYLRANLLPDDVEELACIRDYLVRRLWGVLQAIEEHAVRTTSEDPIRKLGHERKPHDWFSNLAKLNQEEYIEYLISLGLGFLRDVLESEDLRRAELVISNSVARYNYISHAVDDDSEKTCDYISYEYDDGSFDGEGEYGVEALDYFSSGLLWANYNKIPSDYGRGPLKGLRDWGYVFWGKARLQASGVLDCE
ncbi:MAG: hypothetical protein Q9200_002163 [Gallowayella weberi]